jgi:hypothetical protein
MQRSTAVPTLYTHTQMSMQTYHADTYFQDAVAPVDHACRRAWQERRRRQHDDQNGPLELWCLRCLWCLWYPPCPHGQQLQQGPQCSPYPHGPVVPSSLAGTRAGQLVNFCRRAADQEPDSVDWVHAPHHFASTAGPEIAPSCVPVCALRSVYYVHSVYSWSVSVTLVASATPTAPPRLPALARTAP